ncbi:RHS repeat-associated core domain-containing protein [Pseudomonas sp. NPDC089547]|uniref:RHS repeat-associated core domain-containing protein n=1 Tax=Pseudomonas sp. NPDC089547 TaxID=3390652 RepID=UPI003D04BA86
MSTPQSESHRERHNYSAYGYKPKLPSEQTLLGFNGEYLEPGTASYHLGCGYRAYSPVLMRFCSSDSWSPFGKGGLNPYCYCEGDPVNNIDPSGHFVISLLKKMAHRLTSYIFPGFNPPFENKKQLHINSRTVKLESPKIDIPKKRSPSNGLMSTSIATTTYDKPKYHEKKSLEFLIASRSVPNNSSKPPIVKYSLLTETGGKLRSD